MPYEYPEESSEQNPVESFNEITIDGYTYPTDEYGHAKDNDGNTTDPYGHLSYAFGFDVEDDSGMYDFLYCIDFLVLEAHVAFHAVRNTDSGGFIEDAEYRLVRHDRAIEEAIAWAYWAADEVYEHYYINVTGKLIKNYEQYPPNDEEFAKLRETFIADVQRSLKHTPPPAMGYPEDQE